MGGMGSKRQAVVKPTASSLRLVRSKLEKRSTIITAQTQVSEVGDYFMRNVSSLRTCLWVVSRYQGLTRHLACG